MQLSVKTLQLSDLSRRFRLVGGLPRSWVAVRLKSRRKKRTQEKNRMWRLRVPGTEFDLQSAYHSLH